MKKVMSVVSVCLVVVCLMVTAVVPVCAATPKDDIMAKAKELVPAKYQAEYLPMLSNVLQQIDVDAAQAEAVIANMEAAAAAVEKDKGGSLSDYTAQETKAVLDEVNKACVTLNLKLEFRPAANPTHEGDVEGVITTVDGKKVAIVDLDVKKTNVADTNYTVLFAAALLVVTAAGCAVYGKKFVASR